MNQSGIFDQDLRDHDIRALQEWLRSAWRQLGDPALTTFSRRELRNQMKQCSADLKAQLAKAEALEKQPSRNSRAFARPELRLIQA